MYSIEPVKDQSYTLKDVLMKKGKHKMPDGSIMNDEDHLMKAGKRPLKKQPLKKKAIIKKAIPQKPTQQIIQRTSVIVNQADDKPKRRPIRRRIQQPQKQQVKSQLPPYSISTGASGASFTPFYPPAPLYRSMVIASPPTTNDDITPSQKRTAELRTGNMLNNLEKQNDKLNPLEKIEQVIINQNKPIFTENNKEEEPQPPSFEEVFGGIEYKTQDEKDKIERIKIDYEMKLTAKNQKRREDRARKRIAEIESLRGMMAEERRQEIEEEPEELNENQLIMKNLYERKNPDKKFIANFKDLPRDFELEKKLENFEKKNRASNLKKQKEQVDLIVKDTNEADKKFNENMEKIRQSRQQDSSTPSDENMSSRVQSLKRGHIVPMLARYI